MKHSIVLTHIALITVLMVCSLPAIAQDRAVPPLMNYQGKLTDGAGADLGGTHDLTFNIYADPVASGGETPVWGPQVFTGVTLVGGRFNVILSTDTGDRSIAAAFGDAERFLGVQVDEGAEVSPRQQILSAPYALKAEVAATGLWAVAGSYPPGYLDGGVISNSGGASANLAVSAVYCRSDNNLINIDVAAMTKEYSSDWAEGSGAGGRATGSDMAAGVVYTWAIGDSTGVKAGNILMSQDGSAPTLPSGYDCKRLLGGRRWDGSSWQQFETLGKGRDKSVYLYDMVLLAEAPGLPEAWHDIATGSQVPNVTSRAVEIMIITSSTRPQTITHVRPKGSSSTTPSFCTGPGRRSDNNVVASAGRGVILLDDDGEFSVDVTAERSRKVFLSGYFENL